MSVILDAAGGLGSTYAPHFPVSAKGEPGRHELHKMKTTFAKIHGLGTTIYLTHSHVETEGTNLVLECLYRTVEIFLQERKVKKIRNLYIQLDNTNYNKSWALIAGCTALVQAGIVRKVKVMLLIFNIHCCSQTYYAAIYYYRYRIPSKREVALQKL